VAKDVNRSSRLDTRPAPSKDTIHSNVLPATRAVLQRAGCMWRTSMSSSRTKHLPRRPALLRNCSSWNPANVNPNGSGISLGHPIGATGAVITVKALYELQPVNDRYGLVTMLHRRRAGHRGGFRKPGPRLRQLRASVSFEKDRHRRYAMARGRSLLPIPTTDARRLEIGRRDRCIYMGGAEDRRLCSDRRHSERCAD
jgi:hypothetical protein